MANGLFKNSNSKFGQLSAKLIQSAKHSKILKTVAGDAAFLTGLGATAVTFAIGGTIVGAGIGAASGAIAVGVGAGPGAVLGAEIGAGVGVAIGIAAGRYVGKRFKATVDDSSFFEVEDKGFKQAHYDLGNACINRVPVAANVVKKIGDKVKRQFKKDSGQESHERLLNERQDISLTK